MYEINRSLIIVKPKQPYIDWDNHFDDGGPRLSLEDRKENSAYLVDEIEDEESKERVLRKYYRIIFENELLGWMTVKDGWPQKLDYPTFQEWFEVEVHSLVMDVARKDLFREPD